MFDIVSGLFQMNKMIIGYMPGSFVKGLLKELETTHFFRVLINFAVDITLFVDSLQKKGLKL